MNYYYLSIEEHKVKTVAYGPKGAPLGHDLLGEMSTRKDLPFHLELHNVYIKESLCIGEVSDQFHDYQPNSLGWPMLSDRIKKIIEIHLTGKEHIEWKEIIIDGKSISKKYYTPMFMRKLDTLNARETVYGPYLGIIMNHCFDKEKICDLSVFHTHDKFWQIPMDLCVSEDIRKDLKKAGIMDLEFDKVRIV